MKYLQFELQWVDGEAHDPIKNINDRGARVEPVFHIDDQYFAHWIDGDIEFADFEDFQLVEINVDDFFNAALTINPMADMTDDGFLLMPYNGDLKYLNTPFGQPL